MSSPGELTASLLLVLLLLVPLLPPLLLVSNRGSRVCLCEEDLDVVEERGESDGNLL